MGLEEKVEAPQPRRFTRRTLFKLGGAAAAGGALVALGFGTDWFTNLPLGDQTSSQSSFFQVHLESSGSYDFSNNKGEDRYLGATCMVPKSAPKPKGLQVNGKMYTNIREEPLTYSEIFNIPSYPIDLTPKPIKYQLLGTDIPAKNGFFESQIVEVFDRFGKIAEFKTERLNQKPSGEDEMSGKSFSTRAHGIERLYWVPADNPGKAPEGAYALLYFSSKDENWESNRPDKVPFMLRSAGRTIKQGMAGTWPGDIFLGNLDRNAMYELIINEGKLPSFRAWFTPRNLFQYDY